ncbi:hypothetical protein PMAYCL1PPCAC_25144 [Pristionchus mayeri]|uniref:Uncharacterized protein n=1 Tax=Pristionchus mayeri TaxID=1317129 RepID=A0AAN5D242_9BILA|nr:hypothetical protein PMAYCL1PPCAC_25144 [Pristionchus mayeri]
MDSMADGNSDEEESNDDITDNTDGEHDFESEIPIRMTAHLTSAQKYRYARGGSGLGRASSAATRDARAQASAAAQGADARRQTARTARSRGGALRFDSRSSTVSTTPPSSDEQEEIEPTRAFEMLQLIGETMSKKTGFVRMFEELAESPEAESAMEMPVEESRKRSANHYEYSDCEMPSAKRQHMQ